MLTSLFQFVGHGHSVQAEIDRIMAELQEQRFPSQVPVPMREHLASLPAIPDPDEDGDPDPDDDEWDGDE